MCGAIAVARVPYAIKPVARVQTKAAQPSAGRRDYLQYLGRGVGQIAGEAQYLNPATCTFRNVELFTSSFDANWLVVGRLAPALGGQQQRKQQQPASEALLRLRLRRLGR